MRWILTALMGCMFAGAQQVGQNVASGEHAPATFKIGTQLVVETVRVADKKGSPVEGLAAKDFTVTEDGAIQEIRIFEYQRVTESSAGQGTLKTEPENVNVVDRPTSVQIAPETPGKIRYRDRRLLALYFDMTAMPPLDQLRALDAAKKFIRKQMTGAALD